jgi:hypothetical protein
MARAVGDNASPQTHCSHCESVKTACEHAARGVDISIDVAAHMHAAPIAIMGRLIADLGNPQGLATLLQKIHFEYFLVD